MHNNNRLGHHLASSSAWSLAGQIVSTVTTLLFFALLSRTLTPDAVGTYILIMNIIVIASLLGTYGLQTTMIRTIATDLGATHFSEIGKTIATGILLVGSFSALAGILIGGPIGETILNQFFDTSTSRLLMVLITCWLILNCCHIIFTETLRGFHDIKYATIYGASAKNTLLLIFLTLSYVGLDRMSIELTIAAMSLALLITSILAMRHLIKHTQSIGSVIKLSRATARQLIDQSTPIFLTALTYQLVTRAGIFVLGYFATKNELALYGAALQMVVLVVVPLRVINSILPPIISNMYFNNNDHSRLEQTVRSVTTIAAVPSLLVIFILVIFGDQLLTLAYGSFYGSGHLILVVLTMGALSDVIFGPSGFTLVMSGNQTTHLRIQVVTGVCAILLAIMAGFLWGTLGIACMAALSAVLQNLITLYYAKEKTGILCCSFIAPRDLLSVATGIKNLSTNIAKSRNSGGD